MGGIDVSNFALRFIQSSLLSIGPALVVLTVHGSALAQNVVIGRLEMSGASQLPGNAISRVDTVGSGSSGAAFTPWCARYSYLCVSRPGAPLSHVVAVSGGFRSKRSLRFSAEASATDGSMRVR
jgi:hypothetical protein